MATNWRTDIKLSACACLILILIIIVILRETLSLNCSEIQFGDLDTLREKIQVESPRFSKAKNEPRITGGSQRDDDLPYMVAICRKYDEENEYDKCGHYQGTGNVCAGVIIHEYFILTAASCIENFNISGATVVAGPAAFPQFSPLVGEIRSVAHKVVHSNFTRRDDRLDNDLAILKVDRELKKTSNQVFGEIRKIPLSNGTATEKTGKIYGWGCAYFSKNECQNFIAEKMDEATVPIWSDVQCQEMLKELKKEIRIQDFHICAGGENRTGFCYGDPGSPLVVTREGSEEEILVGIASFLAAASCGCNHVPTVYTEVSHYHRWIQKVLAGEYDPGISHASILNSIEWRLLDFIAVWLSIYIGTFGY